MLLQFSVKNFKVFKDKVTLSFIASNYDQTTREEENIYKHEKYGFRILKSAVIYGANASGKSNLLYAVGYMKYFITNNFDTKRVKTEPFLLNTETKKSPSEFEVNFIYDDILYRYGFEIIQDKVISEWLFYKPKTKEVQLFYRDESGFEIHDTLFKKGKLVANQGLVSNNNLLLVVAMQFNEEIAINVMNWFENEHCRLISGLDDDKYIGFTFEQVKKITQRAKILELLKVADIGIKNIQLKKIEENEEDTIYDVLTTHSTYDENKKTAGEQKFSLYDDESSGTQKFFALTAPILDTLKNGYTLFVDELDAKLHPNLGYKILELFNSKEHNPKNAQLIFNTHNTNLLSSGLFRRDQIWFTEKNKFGEAKLYSLANIKNIDKNDNFEEDYVKGKYGAVPYLTFFDDFNPQK